MVRGAFRIGCLVAAWTALADPPPFMTLRLGTDFTARPEPLAQTLEALARYPSCFDALQAAAPLDAASAEALGKLGVALAPPAAQPEQAPEATDDHAPRTLIAGALRFAADGAVSPAVLGNGRSCASGKSAQGLCVESMLALAFGAERLVYRLDYAHEPAAWYASAQWSELALWRPFFQAYVRHNAETKPGGALPLCGKGVRPALAGELKAAVALAPAGLPVCPGSPWPVCYLLNAECVEGLSAAELQRALSGGAVLDGGAVAKLQARGFGAALQVGAAPRAPEVGELFTDDELNLNRVGYVWRPAARPEEAFALFPSNDAVRVIGRYQTGNGAAAEAASVLYETPQGGRVAAFGFAGFGAELSAARRRQLLLAADWVCQNRLPVFVETPSQAVVVPRVTLAGDLRSVAVVNASIDLQPPLTLRLRGCSEGLERMEWLTPKDKPVTVAVRWEGKDALVILPALGPWQVGWLRAAE